MVARLAAKAVTKFLKKRATPKSKPKAADEARRKAGREAADLGTPASEARKPGRTYGKEIHEPSPTDVGIARGERLSTMKGVQKRYNDNKKKLEELKRDVEFLKLKASPGKNKTVMGRHKANQKLKNVKEEIKHLKTSMTDMVKRHNIKKKEGGKVMAKKVGGKMHSPSRAHPLSGIGAGRQMEKWTTLSPAEEKRVKKVTTMTPADKKRAKKLTTMTPADKKRVKKLTTITPAEQSKIDKGIKERRVSLDKDVKEWKNQNKSRGKVIQKKHGGMTHVGLSPAEEARAGTMSEDERAKYMAKGGKVGNKKSQGKRISSKQTDGSDLVASLYD